MPHRNVTFAAAATLFVPAWLGIFSSGIPTILGPLPALTSLPALFLANPGIYWIVVGIPSAIFLLWNPQLLRGVAKIPARTFVLFVLCASLTIFYFVGSWNFGIQYQGARFTYVMCRQRNVRRRYRHFILCVQKRKGFLLEDSYHPLATFCMAGMVCVPLSG
jgi:hypothetical protein